MATACEISNVRTLFVGYISLARRRFLCWGNLGACSLALQGVLGARLSQPRSSQRAAYMVLSGGKYFALVHDCHSGCLLQVKSHAARGAIERAALAP